MAAASEHDAARTPDESTQPRVALVASSAYPNLGGVEQHVRSVARELRDRGTPAAHPRVFVQIQAYPLDR